jgi:hypothetical protein
MNEAYVTAFQNQVYARLGGLEMATEFFTRHKRMVSLTRGYGESYHSIVVDPNFAAEVYFNRVLKPILAADRKAAQRAWAS